VPLLRRDPLPGRAHLHPASARNDMSDVPSSVLMDRPFAMQRYRSQTGQQSRQVLLSRAPFNPGSPAYLNQCLDQPSPLVSNP
jgi:hypothetical protein